MKSRWFTCNDRLMDYAKTITWIITTQSIQVTTRNLNLNRNYLTNVEFTLTHDYSSRIVRDSLHAVEKWKILKSLSSFVFYYRKFLFQETTTTWNCDFTTSWGSSQVVVCWVCAIQPAMSNNVVERLRK